MMTRAPDATISLSQAATSALGRGWATLPRGPVSSMMFLLIKPSARGKAVLFDGLLQPRPHTFVVTRLVRQPGVQQPHELVGFGSRYRGFRPAYPLNLGCMARH